MEVKCIEPSLSVRVLCSRHVQHCIRHTVFIALSAWPCIYMNLIFDRIDPCCLCMSLFSVSLLEISLSLSLSLSLFLPRILFQYLLAYLYLPLLSFVPLSCLPSLSLSLSSVSINPSQPDIFPLS
jgi:hypothetical protein